MNNQYKNSQDCGPKPFVANVQALTKRNSNFRTALWTGTYLQMTLMCIKPGGDIGIEIHPDTDQFLQIEQGMGIVKMGDQKDNLCFQKRVCTGCGIFIPAQKWHNVINTGNAPLKICSIYAPPHHPWGTVHRTQADALADE